MSGTLGDLMLNSARYLTGEQPKMQAETDYTRAQVPYVGALTTKAQMDAELTRIQAQAGSKQMEMIAKGMGGQNNQMPQTDPGAAPYSPAAGYSPSAVAAPDQTAPPPPPILAPGSDSKFGAVAPPPAAAPPPVVGGPPAITPQGTGLAARYPGAYNVADVSGTTPPPASTALAQNAPAPVPVQPPPPAPAPAPLAPAPGPGSGLLAQAGAPPAAQPGGPPGGQPGVPGGYNPQGTSSAGINIPGVGPLPYWAAASMYGAISRGQDPMQAMHAAAEQRYRRLAELARQGDSPQRWNANVLQAWREGLIDNAAYNAEVNHPEKREDLVLSLTDAAHQSQLQANLATHGMGVGPTGIGTAPMAQAAIEGAQGARAAGEGRLVDVKVWNDPTDPTKGFTTQQVPAPGVYRFMQEHTGAEVMGQSGPDPIASMPKAQALATAMQRESGGRNIETQIKDANGRPASTASGYYQMTDDTWRDAAAWAGIKNPPARAMMASREDQDAAASALYDHRGVQPWVASNPNLRFSAAARVAPAVRAAPVPQRLGLGGGGNAPLGQGAPPAPGSLIAQAAANPNATIQAPPVATARPAGGGNTIAMGDSHAGGLRAAGLPATFSNGANPKAVLDTIRATPDNQIAGKDVVLSGGFSNDGNHQNTGLVMEQVAALKEKGAKSVSVLGVGPGGGGDAVNNQLAMAAGPGGYRFVPLEGQFQPDGVHLRNYGGVAKQLQTSQADQSQQPYQTASLGFVPPPTGPRPGVDTGTDTGAPPGGATEAQYLGLPPGPVRSMPSEWHPGPAVTDAVETDRGLRDADAKQMPTIQKDVMAGQSAMRTMQDVIRRLNTLSGFPGAAVGARITVGQFLKDFGPDWAAKIGAAIGGDKFDPANVDQVRILAKELFQMSIAQEHGLTSQGGAQLTNMFTDMLPNIGMSKEPIKDMTNVMAVMQQAQQDYLQGAQEHYGRERMWLPMQRDAQGGLQRYHPLSEWDLKYNNPEGAYTPRTYIGAAAVLNGGKDWREGLNKKQEGYAIKAALRAHPGAVLNPAIIPKRYGGDADD